MPSAKPATHSPRCKCDGCQAPLLNRAQQAIAEQRAQDVAAAALAAKSAGDLKRLAARASIASEVVATAESLARLEAARAVTDPRTVRLAELRRQGMSLAAALATIDKENPS